MSDKLIPRQAWLRDRVKHTLDVLEIFNSKEDWEAYMNIAADLARELLWTVKEWNKCYIDKEKCDE